MDRILNLVAGREQKIAFIEVGNESWQTGFGYSGGLADMRAFCSYIAAHTQILVAITSPGADFTYQGIYRKQRGRSRHLPPHQGTHRRPLVQRLGRLEAVCGVARSPADQQ